MTNQLIAVVFCVRHDVGGGDPYAMTSNTSTASTTSRDIASLGPLGLSALFVVAAPAVGAAVLIATKSTWFDAFAAMDGIDAVMLFLGATVVMAGLSLVPTHAASLLGGVAFGAFFGAGWALVGITGAAVVSFLFMRRVVGDRAVDFIAKRPKAAAVHRALVHRGERQTIGLIALVRLSPVMPFAGTNLLMAATGVGMREFLLGSVVGLAPRIIVVAVAGAGMAELDLSRRADLHWAIVGGVATLLAMVVIGRIARRALRDATRES